MSDRMDRRKVLVGVAALALVADLGFILLAPQGRMMNLTLAALLGGSIYAMYPVIVAHANDHAEPGTAIQISGGLLLTFGIGSIIGPTVAGLAMAEVGIRALFLITAVSHGMVILYTLWRISKREAVAEADKTSFQPINAGRTSSLQTVEPHQQTTAAAQGLNDQPRRSAAGDFSKKSVRTFRKVRRPDR
jgi:Sugar phosphate permease